MIRCHSSGSSCSASSIEPFTSAKSTVTCLRSPSSALRARRIFSARCRGVYARGSGCPEETSASRRPHSPQNLTPGAFSKPQLEQRSEEPLMAPTSRRLLPPAGRAACDSPRIVARLTAHGSLAQELRRSPAGFKRAAAAPASAFLRRNRADVLHLAEVDAVVAEDRVRRRRVKEEVR